jgi:hypothetical protein
MCRTDALVRPAELSSSEGSRAGETESARKDAGK